MPHPGMVPTAAPHASCLGFGSACLHATTPCTRPPPRTCRAASSRAWSRTPTTPSARRPAGASCCWMGMMSPSWAGLQVGGWAPCRTAGASCPSCCRLAPARRGRLLLGKTPGRLRSIRRVPTVQAVANRAKGRAWRNPFVSCSTRARAGTPPPHAAACRPPAARAGPRHAGGQQPKRGQEQRGRPGGPTAQVGSLGRSLAAASRLVLRRRCPACLMAALCASAATARRMCFLAQVCQVWWRAVGRAAGLAAGAGGGGGGGGGARGGGLPPGVPPGHCAAHLPAVEL